MEITLKDGSTLVEHTKAMGLLTPVLGEARSRRLCDTVWALEKCQDARAFTALMQPAE
ncbi:hypothetical protein [Bordetella genomosp. 9]|uniref:hypothetical protein n=1 Tax=Bordetella genomosp. 9 TaxID=1416803 RepID=UPI0015C684E6|nr:hypothetical protein [Bordetella genomosp. 9]